MLRSSDPALGERARLIVQLCGWLCAKQLATTAIRLLLEHERGRDAIEPTVIDIALGEPTWKEEHLVRLLKERLHRIELSAPVIALRLDASKVETAAPASDTLFPEPGGSKEDHARLLELLVARLLIESGAKVPYVGTACPRTQWSDADREWLEAKGTRVQYRASLEMDLAAVGEFEPDLAIGTTPVVQKAKQLAIPALYFTNLISARPLFGVAGAGSLAQVVNAALANQGRFDEMKTFFGDVGEGHCAGVWEDTPRENVAFREKYKKQIEAQAKKRKAEEMI